MILTEILKIKKDYKIKKPQIPSAEEKDEAKTSKNIEKEVTEEQNKKNESEKFLNEIEKFLKKESELNYWLGDLKKQEFSSKNFIPMVNLIL